MPELGTPTKSPLDQLDFASHEAFYRRLCGEANAWDCFREQAIEVHILTVEDALRPQLGTSVFGSDNLANDEARFYMRFGVGRRFGILWRAYRGVKQTVPPDRVEPLSLEEAQSIDEDLNSIYLNIVGIIDNYAWCLRHERISPRLEALQKTQIGLFVPAFMTGDEFEELRPDIDALKGWFEDLRSRRDPAAHRIPLTVAPTQLDDREQEEYQRIDLEINAALLELDFDRIDKLRDKQGQLGQFNPIFFHHPGGPHFPLYPTIPEDIGKLITIATSVHRFLDIGQNETD